MGRFKAIGKSSKVFNICLSYYPVPRAFPHSHILTTFTQSIHTSVTAKNLTQENNKNVVKRRLPAEWETHERTFMSWPNASQIWGDLLSGVRKDIAGIAHAIVKYEPVVVLASPEESEEARRTCGTSVEVVTIPVDDVWTRDTVSMFAEKQNMIVGVDFNFNGWGKKQEHQRDTNIAREILDRYKITRIQAPIVAEGGSFETDGLGTLLVTESSLVNSNRNPGRSRDKIEQDLKSVLGVKKVIWFPGVRGQDITDSHVDALVRFVAPGVVIVNRPGPSSLPDVWSNCSDQVMKILQSATDARGTPFKVVELPEPDYNKIEGEGDQFLSSYVNFYIANGAVFVPKFGDQEADDHAQAILREHLPGRDIIPLEINTLASGGGGIHCATHDQPRLHLSQ